MSAPLRTHVQLAVLGRIRTLIRHPDWNGRPLPSGRALSREWSLSHPVVNKALLLLEAEGEVRRDGNKFYAVRKLTSASSRSPACIHVVSFLDELQNEARATAHRFGAETIAISFDPRDVSSFTRALRLVLEEKPQAVFTMGVYPAALRRFADQAAVPVLTTGGVIPGLPFVHNRDTDRMETAMQLVAGHGHRHIAFFTHHANLGMINRLTQCMKEMAAQLQISAQVFPSNPRVDAQAEAMRQLSLLLRTTPRPTTILCPDDAYAIKVLNAARRLGLHIPADLSVVSVTGLGPAERPEITGICGPGYQVSARLGIITLLDMIHSHPRSLAEWSGLYLQPLVRPGRSLARLGSGLSTQPQTQPAPAPSDGLSWALAPGKVAASWQEPFPSPGTSFRPIDLSSLTNRTLSRHHGWLGDTPLLHLAPGIRRVRGVPFRIAAESSSTDRNCLVLHGGGLSEHKLDVPRTARIPLHAKAEAIYFLHACGYAEPGTFGRYRFLGPGKKILGELPLTLPGPDPDSLASATLQDWWPEAPVLDNSISKPVAVTERGDPELYLRLIYVSRWSAPSHSPKITAIEIELEPGSAPVLGLIAVTASLPAPQ